MRKLLAVVITLVGISTLLAFAPPPPPPPPTLEVVQSGLNPPGDLIANVNSRLGNGCKLSGPTTMQWLSGGDVRWSQALKCGRSARPARTLEVIQSGLNPPSDLVAKVNGRLAKGCALVGPASLQWVTQGNIQWAQTLDCPK